MLLTKFTSLVFNTTYFSIISERLFPCLDTKCVVFTKTTSPTLWHTLPGVSTRFHRLKISVPQHYPPVETPTASGSATIHLTDQLQGRSSNEPLLGVAHRTQESTLLLLVYYKGHNSNSQVEEMHRARHMQRGAEPLCFLRVCHPPSTCTRSSLWRFHYVGTVDQIIDHWWLNSISCTCTPPQRWGW